jgi:hypothetical protein
VPRRLWPDGYSSRLQPHKLLWLVTLGAALTAAWTTVTRAEQFAFSYSGGGVSGNGLLTADQVAPGTWLAVSGTDTTFGGPIAGTLSLTPNPNSPRNAFSSSGYFIYDNQLFPGSDPAIDNGGLLFANGSGGGEPILLQCRQLHPLRQHRLQCTDRLQSEGNRSGCAGACSGTEVSRTTWSRYIVTGTDPSRFRRTPLDVLNHFLGSGRTDKIPGAPMISIIVQEHEMPTFSGSCSAKLGS